MPARTHQLEPHLSAISVLPTWVTDAMYQMFIARLADRDQRFAEQILRVDHDLLAQKDYNLANAAAAEKAINAALAAADRAVMKAEAAAEKRFESVNEFRQTLTDQATSFPTRSEVDTRFSALEEKIAVNLSNLNKLELDLKTASADFVRRLDLTQLNDAVELVRAKQAEAGGKATALAQTMTTGLAVLSILVSIGMTIFTVYFHQGGAAPAIVYVPLPGPAALTPPATR